MIYKLSTATNTHGMVEYDHKLSAPYDLFFEGTPLAGMALDLRYTVKKKSDVEKLAKAHLVQSTGPDLVSDALRAVIERVAPAQAEFFDVSLSFKESEIRGFSAVNLVHKVACVDLEESEYEVTNFDPHDPDYLFLYTVLRDSFESDLDIVRCQEHSPGIVVSDALKTECFNAKLQGLVFYRSVDMTHGNRTICEKI
ncbi:MAG: DUF1629 domain-containing protein [Telluria sp.]